MNCIWILLLLLCNNRGNGCNTVMPCNQASSRSDCSCDSRQDDCCDDDHQSHLHHDHSHHEDSCDCNTGARRDFRNFGYDRTYDSTYERRMDKCETCGCEAE